MSSKVVEFEALWGNYIAKLARLDDLKEQGRYGYQLRMPRKAISIAERRLRNWCAAEGLSFPGETQVATAEGVR